MRKRLLILMVAVLSLMPLSTKAAEQSREVVQHGRIIAFDPSIKSVVGQRTSMVVNIDTVSCALMYQVQWSDTTDFGKSETRFFRNVDNHGCMIIEMEPVRENGKVYNTRTIWYGGYKMSFRRVLRKHPKDRLVTTQGIVNELRNRLRISKRLYVPAKGKYVRVRCIYYGTCDYAYSRWTTPVRVR